jgi:protein-tyrosine-phosphatase
MTQAQRAEVGSLVPRAAARTFTLKELARVAAHFTTSSPDASTRLGELMAYAAGATAHTTQDHDDDLADPYGGPLEGYTSMMRQADEAIRAITAALGGRYER